MSSPSCFSLSRYRRKVSRPINSNSPSLGIPEEVCHRFSLAELKRATNNFGPDLMIGRGDMGKVYKGCIDDGAIHVDVAIKRSYPEPFVMREEWKQEVQVSCQLRHPNLVSLKGFCEEQGEMILVSEYMPNSSLETHLFGIDKQRLLWKQRLQICIDAARGLHYLHCGAKHAIIHRNIKSSNILLDGNWRAKLCDFGLSRMGPPSMSRSLIRVESNRVTGTLGYMEPEYMMSGECTEKSDIYSFGVILFEVLSGTSAHGQGFEQQKLVKWVSECLRNGTIDEIIEPYMKGKIAPLCLHKFVEIAASCVFKERLERPAMGEVEVTLEDAVELQETADSQNCSPHDHTDYTYQYHDMSYLIRITL